MDVVEYVKNSLNLYFGEFEKGYNYINKKVDWIQALLFLTGLGVIVGMFSLLMTFIYDSSGFSELGVSIILVFLFSLMFIPVIVLSSSFISYGILHLLFKLFGGNARFEETMKYGFSLAVFGNILSLFFSLIPPSLFNENSNFVFASLFVILVIVISIWGLIVNAKTFSKLHKLSFGKTLLVLLIPLFVLVLFLTLLMIIIFVIAYNSGITY